MTTVFVFIFYFYTPLLICPGAENSHLKDKSLEPNFLNTKHCCIEVSWLAVSVHFRSFWRRLRKELASCWRSALCSNGLKTGSRWPATSHSTYTIKVWDFCPVQLLILSEVYVRCSEKDEPSWNPHAMLYVNCSLFFFFFAVMTLIFQSVIRTVLCFCVKARCVSIANIELSCFFVNSCFSAVTFEHFKYCVQG